MSMNRKNKTPWFIAGLGLGALVGILSAPKSGRETRKAIARGVDDGRKYVTSIGRDAREQMSNVVESGKRIIVRQKGRIVAWTRRAKNILERAA